MDERLIKLLLDRIDELEADNKGFRIMYDRAREHVEELAEENEELKKKLEEREF